MLGDVMHNLLLLTIGKLYLYKCTIKAYTLCATRCHDRVVIHVIKRILD